MLACCFLAKSGILCPHPQLPPSPPGPPRSHVHNCSCINTIYDGHIAHPLPSTYAEPGRAARSQPSRQPYNRTRSRACRRARRFSCSPFFQDHLPLLQPRLQRQPRRARDMPAYAAGRTLPAPSASGTELDQSSSRFIMGEALCAGESWISPMEQERR